MCPLGWSNNVPTSCSLLTFTTSNPMQDVVSAVNIDHFQASLTATPFQYIRTCIYTVSHPSREREEPVDITLLSFHPSSLQFIRFSTWHSESVRNLEAQLQHLLIRVSNRAVPILQLQLQVPLPFQSNKLLLKARLGDTTSRSSTAVFDERFHKNNPWNARLWFSRKWEARGGKRSTILFNWNQLNFRS